MQEESLLVCGEDWNKSKVPVEAASLHYYRSCIHGSQIPMIIDMGTYQTRAGWASMQSPVLVFETEAYRPKSILRGYPPLFGPELDRLTFQFKYAKKQAFCERNIIYDWKVVESILEYSILNLGVRDNALDQPILMTEPLGKIPCQRDSMSELLFEGYGASHLCYAVDSLLSYFNHMNPGRAAVSEDLPDSLIIDMANCCTNLIPYLDSKVWLPATRRINIGGGDILRWSASALANRFPQHKSKFTPDVARQIYEKLCAVAYDYDLVLKDIEADFERESKLQALEEHWRDEALEKAALGEIQFQDLQKYFQELKLREANKLKAGSCQGFKYYKNEVARVNEDYEAEQLAELEELGLNLEAYKRKAKVQLPWVMGELISQEDIKRKEDMRKEQGRRLKEIMERKHRERRIAMQDELEQLNQIAKLFKQNEVDGQDELVQAGYKKIEHLHERLKHLRNKLGVGEEDDNQGKDEDQEVKEEQPKKKDKFNLLKVPDEKLSPEEMKMKRIQKMQKTAQEMREQRRQQEAKERAEMNRLKENPLQYLKYLYKKRKTILGAIGEKNQKKSDLQFKRKGVAAQRRMQTIVELGLDQSELKGQGKKKIEDGGDDNFGADDQDWAVYLDIGRGGDESEGQDLEVKLAEVESEIGGLSSHFGQFFSGTSNKVAGGVRITSPSDFQITLHSQIIQLPELLFQPYICGVKQAGVSEIFSQIVSAYPALLPKVSENIFITGGNASLTNLIPRLYKDFRCETPSEIQLKLIKARDPVLGAWKGGRKMTQLCSFVKEYCISRAEYQECGASYLQGAHFLGN